ncbi:MULTISPECIES: 50S ribosomal protein L24 [Eubacterium]|uniref:Large ribosomal subunit protein uL24 n=2 Tax=Eubacterium TaxID=1730 RepID=A0A1H4DSU5_9FIRM|nr:MULTISPECIES: 50S ribosomal protein L24 [Eubacterium]MDD4692143.1 50S ribosomal protein L24 [Eubacterium aggregans]MEA5074674.1 50S ribosomal protein L24 [Eubacterium aggregans]SDY34864.1 LSU ribosomal protein L24P [Eubacterium barkeri]SEA75579.1 LSU ribosomal protein L24P [Eubacterium aggregans]
MANKMHVKKGDIVQVISGKDKGKTGAVLEAFPGEGKVTVEGANIITRHKKPSAAMQQGGIIKEEGKIDASNVLLMCDKCGRGVRTGVKIEEDGSKVRVCKKCGAVLDN